MPGLLHTFFKNQKLEQLTFSELSVKMNEMKNSIKSIADYSGSGGAEINVECHITNGRPQISQKIQPALTLQWQLQSLPKASRSILKA
jgi:hypothetical protein